MKNYEERINNYNKNSKLCKNCDIILSYKQRHNKFCSQSCAAKFNNVHVKRKHGPTAKPKQFRNCGYCNKKTYNRVYCSFKCRSSGKQKYHSENYMKARNAHYQSRYRSKKYRVPSEDANSAIITEIYKNCPEGFEVDHIIPLSKGGKHHENNLQYLPKSLNRTKGNKINCDYDISIIPSQKLKPKKKSNQIPWNKGRKGVYSEESLKKMSEFAKKRKVTDITKEKISQGIIKHNKSKNLQYEFVDKNGKKEPIACLKSWCKENDLDYFRVFYCLNKGIIPPSKRRKSSTKKWLEGCSIRRL